MSVTASHLGAPAEAPTPRTEALSVRGVTKRFGSTLALDGAELVVARGSVHALLGGNGSGKSTVIKVLAGLHRADGGSLSIGGAEHDLSGFGPAEARAAGLRFVHQDLGLFDGLSVVENFALDAGYPTRGGAIRWRALTRRVSRLLHDYELDVDVTAPVNTLRPSDRTMVAIARALQTQDEGGAQGQDDTELVLVLDEPTASLPQHESELLLARIRRRAELGQTVVMVSHRLAEVRAVADDFTIFRDGRTVAALVDARPTEDELVALMAGRTLQTAARVVDERPVGSPFLRVQGLSAGALVDADLDVAAGEILGIAGLAGTGRSTLMRVLFGHQRPTAGTMSLGNTPYAPRSVADAVAAGVALVPEDRAREAAFVNLPIVDNLSANRLRSYWSPRGMSRRRERSQARSLLRDFVVRAAGPDAAFGSMSGGNQQKVILARWLQLDPRLLLLDEPTQGVDVMSRVDIYRIVREAAGRGTAVIVVSSDPHELAALCHRVAVLHDGRFVEHLRGADVDLDTITTTMLLGHSGQREAS